MPFHQAPEIYNPDWPEMFKSEAQRIHALNLGAIISIDHIGSTAVAGLMAKPIIDILIEVTSGSLVSLVSPLESLQYISKGENGIPGRSYFTRKDAAIHIHCFEKGHVELKKHLSFRNFLRAHPQVRKEYEDLKKSILSQPGLTRDKYQKQKSDFLNRVVSEAKEWNEARFESDDMVKKVIIYVVRKRNDQPEVLVFDHMKFPEVSPQVPAGTVEKNENNLNAAKRELFEESGLSKTEGMEFLGSYVYFRSENQQFQERHIFMMDGEGLPDEWIHTVLGDGEDKSMGFSYYWMPVSKAESALKANFGDALKYFKMNGY